MPRKILTTPWPSVLWAVVIFIMLTIDTGSVESVPVIPHLDKAVHAFIFGLLAFLWVFYRDAKRKGAWLWVFIITALYGAGMEFFQENFTTREFEWNDIIADSVGALAGALIGKKIGPYGNRGRNQN